MSYATYEKLEADRDNNSDDTFSKALNSTADFICSVYNAYPSWARGEGSVSNLAGMALDNMCKARLPQLPQANPPFEGGQCAVQYDTKVYGKRGDQNFETVLTTGLAIGPIVEFKGFVGSDGLWRYRLVDDNGARTVVEGPYGGLEYIRTEIVGRTDGLPDNCGSRPGEYANNGVPSGSALSSVINVPQNDGNTLSIPIIYVAPEIKFPISIDFGGFPLTFDAGGVTFEFGGGGTTNDDKLKELKAIATATQNRVIGVDLGLQQASSFLGQKIEGSEEDIKDAILESQNQILSKLKDTTQRSVVEFGINAPIPSNITRQTSSDGQAVYFLGWFAWKWEGSPIERIRIEYPYQVFIAPQVEIFEFEYNLYPGVSGGFNRVLYRFELYEKIEISV